MNRLKLAEDHLTGITGIDNRYHALFSRINNTLFPESAEITTENISNTLAFLVQYMEDQFSDEERMMEYYYYHRHDDHQKQHLELRRKVEQLYRQAQKAECSRELAYELYSLLDGWFTCHILEWDHHYALFTQRQTRREYKKHGLTSGEFSTVEIMDHEDHSYFPSGSLTPGSNN